MIEKDLNAIRSQYRTDENDIIQDSGKFEAEHIATVYFWHATLDGGGDESYSFGESGEFAEVFSLSPEEREAFKLSDDEVAFVLRGTSYGFVYGAFVTQDQLDAVTEELERAEALYYGEEDF
jgi:hypothetical protein